MSAHYGAPDLRRPQLATPSFTASPQGSSAPMPGGGAPVVRRKALFVAAATLCAPALVAIALAAIGATGGGGQAGVGALAGAAGPPGTPTPTGGGGKAGMGSLAGPAALRGPPTPAVSSPAASTEHKPSGHQSDTSHQSD